MIKYIIRRIVYMIPILFGITLLTFFIFNVVGGDPAAARAGRHATAQEIQVIRAELGLDKPLPVQYINYVKQILTFDFGRSWATKQEITQMIDDGVSPSLSLTLPGFLLSTLISIALALLVARYRGGRFDRFTMISSLGLESVSSLVFILFFQYILAYQMGLFPISGWDPSFIGRWNFLLLPIMIYVFVTLGYNVLFFRSVFLDEIFQDYVRTARSKGLDEKTILFKHVLRNAMVPIITVTVLQIPFLILGSILLESFFGIPGLGGMLVQAINNADFPVIKAMVVILAILYMFGQLASDILYAVVDPKIQLR